MPVITPKLSIPEGELTFTASRAGGPGGQHVNKVSSRVTLRFDVMRSPSLTLAQKRRVGERLKTRMSGEGILRVVCRKHRSQAANRAEAVERFVVLMRTALKRTKPRARTTVPAAEKRRRLEQKRRRGSLKRERRLTDPDT
jgi:ribosome-associated protein